MTEDVDLPDVADAEPASPAPEPAPVVREEDDTAQEARLWGWKAPDEWQGEKPAGYIDDPSRYLDRLKSSRLFKTFEEKMNETVSRIDNVYKSAVERERQQFREKLAELQERQMKAVEVADVAEYQRLEKQKSDIHAQAAQVVARPQVNQAVVEDYVSKNDWAKDPALRMEGAAAIDAALRAGRQFRDERDQLQYAESVMRMKYPHVFQPPAPPRQRVDGGGLAGGAASASSDFDKLPSDARQAFKRMVNQGLFTDDAKGRSQYAKDYNNA
jgi:hypothetical protein